MHEYRITHSKETNVRMICWAGSNNPNKRTASDQAPISNRITVYCAPFSQAMCNGNRPRRSFIITACSRSNVEAEGDEEGEEEEDEEDDENG